MENKNSVLPSHFLVISSLATLFDPKFKCKHHKAKGMTYEMVNFLRYIRGYMKFWLAVAIGYGCKRRMKQVKMSLLFCKYLQNTRRTLLNFRVATQISYNRRQNIWQKVEKSRKLRQELKILTSAFA